MVESIKTGELFTTSFFVQAKRQRKRDKASHRSATAAKKQVSKYLMAKILEQVSGEKSKVSMAAASHEDIDMFKLPPLPKKDEASRSDEE